MKKIIFIILFSSLFSCWSKIDEPNTADILYKKNNLIAKEKDIGKIYQSKQKISFNGKWEWKSKDSTSSFQLRIIQTGIELKAQYCAVQYSGNRMDCDFDTNFNIHGKVKDNKAIVKSQNGQKRKIASHQKKLN